MDNDITNKCRGCSKCEFDRPRNIKKPLQHLPVVEYPFQIISADWFNLNGNKFLVIVDWYSGYFDVKGPFINPDAAAVISSLRESFINTAVCDVFWSDGGPPFGSPDVNEFLKRWGVEWRPSSPRYPQGNSVAESAVKWAKSLLRKCWRSSGQPLRRNEKGSKEFCSGKTNLTNPQVYLQPSCCMVIPYRTLSPVTKVLYHEVGMTKNFELTGKQQKEKKNWKNTITEVQKT